MKIKLMSLLENFYNTSGNYSLLEKVVINYLNNDTISLVELIECIKNYKEWERLDQYYYIPILMTLIKSILLGYSVSTEKLT